VFNYGNKVLPEIVSVKVVLIVVVRCYYVTKLCLLLYDNNISIACHVAALGECTCTTYALYSL
jgi:hypothetical protein